MTVDKTGVEVVVADAPERQRFEISVDGTVVGSAHYRDHDGRRIFFHTEVDGAYGGRGLGTILVRESLDAMRAAGTRVVPVCPLFKAFVEKHDDYADIVDKPTRDDLSFLRERT
ncbi:GNAT family N-acetyltransferase [uncultured Williamsia sp.]|uniref:GNAT family N-acetyltransferase n=1 Tax=uncultured Williamsia sp. TaxID=259311 RepID=UPI00261CE039|nr:GNAT family N-acetyltransferase [uncultured Williamsia sp.]